MQRYLKICEKTRWARDNFDGFLLAHYPTIRKREVQSMISEQERMQRFVRDDSCRRAIDAYKRIRRTHVWHE